MDFVVISERVAFVGTLALLVWLFIDVNFVNKCEESKKTTRNKIFFIPLIFILLLGVYGLLGETKYTKSLKMANRQQLASSAASSVLK
jgi:hypothetical protein